MRCFEVLAVCQCNKMVFQAQPGTTVSYRDISLFVSMPHSHSMMRGRVGVGVRSRVRDDSENSEAG